MILAFLTDPFLRGVVRRAALPGEDVFWSSDDLLEAARKGAPRLVLAAEDDSHPLGAPREFVGESVPLLNIAPATLQSWNDSHRMVGFAVRRVDDHGRRLRGLMTRAAGRDHWVDRLLARVSSATGRRLPPALRGFGRRILEFPSRYSDLHAVADLTGISRGALKARFRRRDLPSPYTYLRWFRLLAAVRILQDGAPTTEEAAYRVGLHSSGNFCRYVSDVSGFSPSDLRGNLGRIRAVTGFVEECLGEAELDAWVGLGELFLEGAA